MLQYILESIAFQLLFLVIYDFFLKRETFFQWNRVYLLGTYALSMLLPWIKIEAFKNRLPQQFNGYSEFLWNLKQPETAGIVANAPKFDWTWQEILLYGGMMVATLILGYKLWQLYQLKRNGKVIRYADFTQVVISNSTLAFSFFKSIFIGDKVLEKKHDTIIAHELVHIKQRHTWDLLFFELMRIIGWFNPLVYVYQSRTAELHEFIADAHVAKERKSEHYQQLLSQVFQTEHISFINQFFTKSLVKKRIVMLQKSKSKKIWQLKYLLLIPTVLGMLAYTSCEDGISEKDKAIENMSLNDKKLIQELKQEIDQKIEKQGSISNIYLSDDLPKRYKSLEKLSKRDFFEYKILYKQYLNELLTVSYPSMGDSVPKQVLERVEKIPLPSTDEYNYYLENLNESYVSQNVLLGENAFPFGSVQEVPIFPGCENADDQRACFNDQMQKHISKNFNYPLAAQKAGIQGRVSVMFTISSKGTIENIIMRGPDKLLEDEVERIINKLPLMTPGKNKGKVVNVPFSIPVNFRLQEEVGNVEKNSLKNPSLKPKNLYVEANSINHNGIIQLQGQITDGAKGLPGVDIINSKNNSKSVSDFEGRFAIEAEVSDIINFEYLGLALNLNVTNSEDYHLSSTN